MGVVSSATAISIGIGAMMAGGVAAGVAMSNQPKDKPNLTMPESPSSGDALSKARESSARKRKAIAANDTTFTDTLGASAQANINRKVLLGQ